MHRKEGRFTMRSWVRLCVALFLVSVLGSNAVAVEVKSKAKEIKLTVPRGYPKGACENFTGLLTGRYKENHVPPIFGARVALLTEAMLTSGKTGRRVDCAKLAKKSGVAMRSLAKT